MNSSYSTPDTYYPRWITPALQRASQDHAVVVLTGARRDCCVAQVASRNDAYPVIAGAGRDVP